MFLRHDPAKAKKKKKKKMEEEEEDMEEQVKISIRKDMRIEGNPRCIVIRVKII
jgi:hypothetical protein